MKSTVDLKYRPDSLSVKPLHDPSRDSVPRASASIKVNALNRTACPRENINTGAEILGRITSAKGG